jgi:tetratricopeptide (TPR) repeat protein
MPADEVHHADQGAEARVDAAVAHVHRTLQQYFRLAGWGSVGRVEKAMGIGRGTIGAWRRRKQLDLRNLFRILYHLGDPARFWALAYPYVPLAGPPPGPVKDPLVRAIRESRGTETGVEPRTLSEDEMHRLDGLCAEEPRAALRKSKAALKQATGEQQVVLLAVYGSARLALGRLREALDALHLARELAESRPDRGVRGDVLRRLGDAYEAADCHAMALLFVKEAWYQYRLAEDASGEARCLTVLAGRLERLGHAEEAHLARATALRLLPSTSDETGAVWGPHPIAGLSAGIQHRIQAVGIPHRIQTVGIEHWIQACAHLSLDGHSDLLEQGHSSSGVITRERDGDLPRRSTLDHGLEAEWVDDSVMRVHRGLQKLFRLRGWGSVRGVERQLGLGNGTLRKWRSRKRLDLRTLFRILDRLGNRTHFWSEVYPEIAFSKPALRRPKDRAVQRVLERESGGSADDRRKPAPRSRGTWPEWLLRLDELRHDNPRAALRKTLTALESAGCRWRPALLAVYGSVRRALGHLDQALDALHHSLELARQRGDRRLLAEALQRLGVAYAYRGNQELGLFYGKQAWIEHRLAGDETGEGRSLVDQGARFTHLGLLEDAVTAYRLAVRILPDREVYNRFGAYLGLALHTRKLRRLGEALAYARQGEKLASQVGPSVAYLYTTTAGILAELGNHAEAERSFTKALELFVVHSPIDAALASVDLARVQLARGRTDAANDTLKAMARFVEKLDNRLVRAAMVELMRISLSGRVTSGILDQAARVIREHRGRTADEPLSGRSRSARSSGRPR